ncbi:ATP-grasp fold amidoligase family protein [Arenibacter amylolyticus]|uniref:ATP-grasp fold amidoligase family protein n=1 Tax=Arenibacter amylolyticus TaxID=1406873 RepID=UPI00159332EE|nr:ATP-grasp fold amidoligase family protein [Arenibacter amylolyticus]
MSLRQKLKEAYYNNKCIEFFLGPVKNLYDFYRYNLITDEYFTKIEFKRNFGYDLDLNNPRTLNEKIQWLKLKERTKLQTICADKIAVRDYVTIKVGKEILIPIYKQIENINDLNTNNVPNEPFIIKTNHDSGSYKIIKDKNNVDWSFIRSYFVKALKNNFYNKTKEWQYKNIEPKIFLEKLLISKTGGSPDDYKFHCFNGKVEFISIDRHRGTEKHTRNWYDKNWNIAEFYWSSINQVGKETLPSKIQIPPPPNLMKMIKIANKLSEDFKYVRVDLYLINNDIFFGELTFHHDSGFRPIIPSIWDLKLGNLIQL